MARLTNFYLPLLLTLLAITLSACGERAEVVELGPLEKPKEHDTFSLSSQKSAGEARRVVVPEGVDARAVLLSLRGPGEEEPLEVEVALGKQLEIDGYQITADHYLPAFVVQNDTITSKGVEEENPAVYVLWQEGETKLFVGWAFRNYPAFTSAQVEGYELKMLGVKSSQ